MSLSVNNRASRFSFGTSPQEFMKVFNSPLAYLKKKMAHDAFETAFEAMANGKNDNMHELAKLLKVEIPKDANPLDYCKSIAGKMGLDVDYVEKKVAQQRIINDAQNDFQFPGFDPKTTLYLKDRLNNFGRFNQ